MITFNWNGNTLNLSPERYKNDNLNDSVVEAVLQEITFRETCVRVTYDNHEDFYTLHRLLKASKNSDSVFLDIIDMPEFPKEHEGDNKEQLYNASILESSQKMMKEIRTARSLTSGILPLLRVIRGIYFLEDKAAAYYTSLLERYAKSIHKNIMVIDKRR